MIDMGHLYFATGNSNKFYEASSICAEFDIELVQKSIDIHEIQHHDPIEITREKAKSAYLCLGKPVVVNDSSWAIPALGGFPGGYMKDVSVWLSAANFQALMRAQDDHRIYLTDTVMYYDGDELRGFSHRRAGTFMTNLETNPAAKFDSIVQMDGEPATIAEIIKKGNWDVSSSERYRHWYDFAEWYQKIQSKKG